MKLPLKTRILKYAIDCNTEFTLQNVLDDLKPEYEGERLYNPRQVEEYVDSYLGVGFFDAAKMELDSSGQLLINYIITDYGKERKKYIKQG